MESDSSDDEGNQYESIINEHRVEIVKYLDLDRQFMLSYLRSHHVLDTEDCELILNNPSSQQKNSKFLDTLNRKGPDAFDYFVKALEIENHYLFELITGRPPVSKINCQPDSSSSKPWILKDVNLLDHDREYFVKELVSLSRQHQDLWYMHSKTISEMSRLEQVVQDLKKDLEDRDNSLNTLRMRLDAGSDGSFELQESISMYKLQCQQVMKENYEQKENIITLQQRVMEMKEWKSLNDMLKSKNEELLQQIRNLTIEFDLARSDSERLSESVRRKDSELEESHKSKKEFYNLKFQLASKNEELTECRKKIEELKKSSLALTGRHDEMHKQKVDESMKVTRKNQQICDIARQVQIVETQLERERLALEASQRHNERLREDCQMYKEQIECYNNEREIAIRERNQAYKDKEEAVRYYREIQKSRDETAKKQVDINNRLQRKITNLTQELESLKLHQVAVPLPSITNYALNVDDSMQHWQAYLNYGDDTPNESLESDSSTLSLKMEGEASNNQSSNVGRERIDTGDVLGKVHRRLEGRSTLKEPTTPSPTAIMLDDPMLFVSPHRIKSSNYKPCDVHGNNLCACPQNALSPRRLSDGQLEVNSRKEAVDDIVHVPSINAQVKVRQESAALSFTSLSPPFCNGKKSSDPLSIKSYARSRSTSIDALAASALANLDLTFPAKQDSSDEKKELSLTEKIKKKVKGKKKLRRVTCQVYYPTPEDRFNEMLKKNATIAGTLSRDRTTVYQKHGRSKSMPDHEINNI